MLLTLAAVADNPWFSERPVVNYDPERRISLDFENADLVYIFKVLAKEMGRNIYVGPSVEGSVTIKFRGVTVEEALRQLVAFTGHKYDYKIVKTTVIVAAPDKLSQIPKDILDDDNIKEACVPPWSAPAQPPPRARAGYLGDLPIIGTFFRGSAPRMNTESYDPVEESGFQRVEDYPLSTFSADIDTAAYSNIRRFLRLGQFPPPDAVRLEEMVNYFTYDYPQPDGRQPFSVSTEVSECPWEPKHKLLRLGIQGRNLPEESLPPRNLVFLLDVSGSMDEPTKLPLVKRSMKLLLKTLGQRDRVAIVVYAGASGVVLKPTPGSERQLIVDALERLHAGGSTNGGAGISLAYRLARENFDPAAVNRVILATDGDFNVGVSSRGALIRLIEQQRQTGVYLSVLGFGSGDLKDSQMEQLADKGNGNYAYIDNFAEARRVLVQEGNSTLITLAKDVKFQVEFNPREVSSYRLIGYENRRLEDRDFEDDKKDAGEIGPGHSVTVFYELVPGVNRTEAQRLRYQHPRQPTQAAGRGELALVKLRYKEPDEEVSRLLQVPVRDTHRSFDDSSREHRFAASVAAFAMLLHESEYSGSASYEKVSSWARHSLGDDACGTRYELVKLVGLAKALKESPGTQTAAQDFRGGYVRQEFVLQRAPSEGVMNRLSQRYQRVKFITHPTTNGFYAVGNMQDVLQIKRELPGLDVTPGPPIQETLRVRHGNLVEMRTLLETLVPDVSFQFDMERDTLIVKGPAWAVAQVKEIFAELDRPLVDNKRETAQP